MNCPEHILGAQAYFAALAALVFILTNLVKRVLPGDLIPLLAFILGWMLDAASGSFLCGLSYAQAGVAGLAGGAAGLTATGSHEAFRKLARRFGAGALVDRLLGRAKAERAKREAKPKTKTPPVAMLFLIVSLSGCALLPRLMQSAQYLGSVIDAVEMKTDRYFARHPNQEKQQSATNAVQGTRAALAVYNGAMSTAEAIDDGDLDEIGAEVRDEYQALYDLLHTFGVTEARPPDGGAESDAPKPEPFTMPPPDRVLR